MRGSSASARVVMVVASRGQLYLLPEHRPAKFERIDSDGLHEAGYGPDDFDERPGNRLALRRCIGRHA
jgi:hypothetical protein